VQCGVSSFQNPVTLIYKPIYWIYRVTSGLWYGACRRFTLAGMAVAGGFIIAGVMGVDIENTVSYQSFALLLAFLLLALVNVFFFRVTFSATRSLPRFGTAGQPLRYHVQVKNLTAKAQVGLVLIEELADPRPAFQEWLAFQRAENRRVRPFRVSQRRWKNPFRRAKLKAAEVPPLPAHGEARVPVEVLPLHRGILRFTGRRRLESRHLESAMANHGSARSSTVHRSPTRGSSRNPQISGPRMHPTTLTA